MSCQTTRILEIYEILEKYQLWLDTQPSAQSLFEKLNFANSSQKHAKVHIKIFLLLKTAVDIEIKLNLNKEWEFLENLIPCQNIIHIYLQR